MSRNLQIWVVSIVAVTLFVLLVHPAIISLEIRTTPTAKKMQLQQAIVLALVFFFLAVTALRLARNPLLEQLSRCQTVDELAVTCTRRC